MVKISKCNNYFQNVLTTLTPNILKILYRKRFYFCVRKLQCQIRFVDPITMMRMEVFFLILLQGRCEHVSKYMSQIEHVDEKNISLAEVFHL